MDVFAFVKDGKVTQYPVGIQEIKRANPTVSFPKDVSKLTDSDLANLGAVKITDSAVPTIDHSTHYLVKRDPVLESGSWVCKWEGVAKTTEEKARADDFLAEAFRKDRNQFLTECDWTVLSDSPLAADKLAEWKTYRQELRDISKQTDFPQKITWPTKPS